MRHLQNGEILLSVRTCVSVAQIVRRNAIDTQIYSQTSVRVNRIAANRKMIRRYTAKTYWEEDTVAIVKCDRIVTAVRVADDNLSDRSERPDAIASVSEIRAGGICSDVVMLDLRTLRSG